MGTITSIRKRCKYAIYIVSVLIITLFSVTLKIEATPIQLPDFELAAMLKRIQMGALTTFPTGQFMEGLSVSENGQIAVVFRRFDQKSVCIMDLNGNFIRGFTLSSSGDIQIFWNGDKLCLYFVRGERELMLNPDGTIYGAFEVPLQQWNHPEPREQKYAGKIYRLEGQRTLAPATYTRLVCDSGGGTKTILYDSGKRYSIWIFLIVALPMVLLLIFCRPGKRRAMRNNESE